MIIIDQQLGQISDSDVDKASFSQPQMHSFNYDEQTDQLLQRREQQILPDQDYASESVTADYNLDSESSFDIRKQNVRSNEELTYSLDGTTEQSENNIEYGEMTHKRNPTKYFDKVVDDSPMSTRFYTTLPNREAAEKLAALAAAGNINSHLIGQLQKQQKKNMQKDESMPLNHKNDDEDDVINYNKSQIDDDQQQKYNQLKSNQNSQQHHHSYKVQHDEKLPLQITVPDYAMSDNNQSDVKKDNTDIEYEYENEDGEIEEAQSTTLLDANTTSHDNDSHNEFGNRLRS